MDVPTHYLTYCHHGERGLNQHCPWKRLCCSLPAPASSNPVLAHCWHDWRVSQNRDYCGQIERIKWGWIPKSSCQQKKRDGRGTRANTGSKNSVAMWVDLVHSAWGNVLQRGLMMCLNRSRSKISLRIALFPCHGTWAEISAETPNTKSTAMARGTFWWLLIVHQFTAL